MPFDTEHVPCYLDDLGHRVMKDKSGEEIKVVDLTFRIEPMTPILAAELDDAIKGTLFRRNDAEINPHLKSVVFSFQPKPQEIVFRPDPMIAKASLELGEAKLTQFRARKPKDGNHWVFLFRATTAHLTGADLLYLQEALYKQHFLTFANAVAGLFDQDAKAEKRARGRAVGAGAAAATH